MNNFSVSVVIPNFNGRFLLEKNLPSVIACLSFKNNAISEIIVVDDGSSDESVSFVEQNFSGQIKLVKHSKNRGFSAAVNTGVKAAKGNLICLLNTDVRPSSNFLVQVLPHFLNKSVFGVSLHEKGYGSSKGLFKNGFIVHSPGKEVSRTTSTFWVSGGSGVFNRHLWNRLGGMDDKLLSPFYWEDIDLSYRALKAGYQLLWEPNSLVVHEHESTVKNLNHQYVSLVRERNQLLFMWKNLTSRRMMRKHLSNLFLYCLRHPGYLRVVLLALWRWPALISARLKTYKLEKVSDEAIFASFI